MGARKSTARRTHLLQVARSTGIAARHTMPSASLASRASARKSSARRTHLIFLEECKVARSTTREMAVRAAARQTLQTASLAPRARALRGSARRRGTVMSQVARRRAAARQTLQTASLAPRARALRGSARRRGTVMSQVARSTTGGAAGERTTGMTAASKGTGASEIGLADDLGSIGTVPFGCLLLSLPIRAALGVPFWRGFLGIHFKSMYIDFLSSHRKK